MPVAILRFGCHCNVRTRPHKVNRATLVGNKSSPGQKSRIRTSALGGPQLPRAAPAPFSETNPREDRGCPATRALELGRTVRPGLGSFPDATGFRPVTPTEGNFCGAPPDAGMFRKPLILLADRANRRRMPDANAQPGQNPAGRPDRPLCRALVRSRGADRRWQKTRASPHRRSGEPTSRSSRPERLFFGNDCMGPAPKDVRRRKLRLALS